MLISSWLKTVKIKSQRNTFYWERTYHRSTKKKMVGIKITITSRNGGKNTMQPIGTMMMMMMMMMVVVVVFVVWLINKRCLALFPARAITRVPRHHKPPTCHKQDMNLPRTCVKLSWMMCSSNNHYTISPQVYLPQ